ncbi:hypothetical protein RsS62_46250 [Rhizobium dioscoreae]|uniref:hypothetical protein n=1 Tax=Rhizobium dioscoreae TaxID=2653122 RepID=UPI001260E5DB|nr:hypothetical protein [Rhizobium dioscoreae]GES45373.1 hypothetical protein RsS62_46250 [Rhizobium dioscoreae]
MTKIQRLVSRIVDEERHFCALVYSLVYAVNRDPDLAPQRARIPQRGDILNLVRDSSIYGGMVAKIDGYAKQTGALHIAALTAMRGSYTDLQKVEHLQVMLAEEGLRRLRLEEQELTASPSEIGTNFLWGSSRRKSELN